MYLIHSLLALALFLELFFDYFSMNSMVMLEGQPDPYLCKRCHLEFEILTLFETEKN